MQCGRQQDKSNGFAPDKVHESVADIVIEIEFSQMECGGIELAGNQIME